MDGRGVPCAEGRVTMSGFQEQDIKAGWEAILGDDRYRLVIADTAANYPEKKSVTVSYKDIEAYDIDFALNVLEYPDLFIAKGKETIKASLPPTWDGKREVNLRIVELPRDAKVDIRHLRSKHLGKLVAVEGLVRKATSVRPRMTHALFRCARCNAEMWEGSDLLIDCLVSGVAGICKDTISDFSYNSCTD